MIPRLSKLSPIQALYLNFLEHLKDTDFSGDIKYSYRKHKVLLADNSVYLALPQNTLYPKTDEDISIIARLAKEKEFQDILLLPPKENKKEAELELTDGLFVNLWRYRQSILDITKKQSKKRDQAENIEKELTQVASGRELYTPLSNSDENEATSKNVVLEYHHLDHASLMEEWLKKMEKQGVDLAEASQKAKAASPFWQFFPKLIRERRKSRGEYDFSHMVHDSMMQYLANESCVGQQVIEEGEPEFRARFLELYYSRYLRPFRHHFLVSYETKLPKLAHFSRLYNWVLQKPSIINYFNKSLGLIDVPLLSDIKLKKELEERGVSLATPEILEKTNPYNRHKLVIVIQDTFTCHFDTQLVLDTMEFLKRLGFDAFLAPYQANGKLYHRYGFLKAFAESAETQIQFLQKLASYNIPLVGIDPSMTLTYRSEYKKALEQESDVPTVHLLQEWLVEQKEHLATQPFALEDSTYHLLPDCAETDDAPKAGSNWEEAFSLLGLSLKVKHTGYCGMAGTHGYETANYENARATYDSNWSEVVSDKSLEGKLVATSFSCRHQVKRFSEKPLLHPLQALLKHLKEAAQL